MTRRGTGMTPNQKRMSRRALEQGYDPAHIARCYRTTVVEVLRCETYEYERESGRHPTIYGHPSQFGNLTSSQQRDIVKRLEAGESQQSVADRWGITRHLVIKIRDHVAERLAAR
jgi:hypothetical protein